MSRASHKLAGSYISLGSTMLSEDLRDLVKAVAARTMPTGLYRGAKARIELRSEDADRLHFTIGWNRPIMMFSVRISEHPSGGSQLRSRIDSFRTSQDTVGGLLPVGPKQLDGWNWYFNFMLNLETAVIAEDPAVNVGITEAAS